MKQLLWGSLCALLLFTGCKKEKEEEEWMIWDFACFSIYVEVRSAEDGSDLLDPENEKNILDQPIKAIYRGKEYPMRELEWGPRLDTRENAPRFYGLLRMKPYIWSSVFGEYVSLDMFCLAFGEVSPGDDHEGEELTIDWGDGTTNTITFDCFVEWKAINDPEVHWNLWLDGQLQREGMFAVKILR